MLFRILAFIPLALAQLLARLRRAGRSRDRREQARCKRLELQARLQLEWRHVDLGPVPGDRVPDSLGHLGRRDFPRHRVRLQARLRPHAGFVVEGWADHRDTDSRVQQLLPQRQGKSAQGELGGVVTLLPAWGTMPATDDMNTRW